MITIRLLFTMIFAIAYSNATADIIIEASGIQTQRTDVNGKIGVGIIEFTLKGRVTPDQKAPPADSKVTVIVGEAGAEGQEITWSDLTSGAVLSIAGYPNVMPIVPGKEGTVKIRVDGRTSKNVLKVKAGQNGKLFLDPPGRPSAGTTQTFLVAPVALPERNVNFLPLPEELGGSILESGFVVTDQGGLTVTYQSTSDPNSLEMLLNEGVLYLEDTGFGVSTIQFDKNVPIGTLVFSDTSDGGEIFGHLSGKVNNDVFIDDLTSGIGPEFFGVDFMGTFSIIEDPNFPERELTTASIVYGESLGSELTGMSLFSLSVPEPNILMLFSVGVVWFVGFGWRRGY